MIKPRCSGRKAGVTLVEVVISLSIFGIAVGAMINGHIYALHQAEASAYSLAAHSLALQRLEQTRAAKWDRLASPPVDDFVQASFPPLTHPTRCMSRATLTRPPRPWVRPTPRRRNPPRSSGDAITVLSKDWNDANSGKALNSRVAGNTTVNAPFLAGIVPSGGGYYSGGVENFPRFLETWDGKTLTYNGSMVVMFNSQTATAPWGMGDVYSPPARNWAFDVNFLDSTKLPPGTPMVRALIRGQWATIRPGTIN